MTFKLYNTLTGKIDVFKPRKSKKINLFVCGITPYDYPHIGHAKTYTQFDFIVKYLKFKKYKVFYLQNVTDIDDRIIEKAKSENKSWKEISTKYASVFLDNMKDLHINSIDKYAYATEYIPQIISQVKTLIKKGYAYKIEDGYYFDLKKFPDYGKLSGRLMNNAESAVSRIDDSKNKKNKGDFCLWKFSKSDEPSWPSDIGSGRPGWHIEDTAITETFFGPQYDIHGGARDLIFPHHEAEIAQMESASGKKPLVKYWLHTGFLNVKGTKMSKSLKNFITIRDALKEYDYKVLRFFFFTNHYSKPIDFSDANLEQAKNSLERIKEFISRSKGKKGNVNKELIEKARKSFFDALNDDFDTPKATSVLFDFIREANKNDIGNNCYRLMKEIDAIFDLFDFTEEKIPKEIKLLAEKRENYRQLKDWKKSDEIREEIRKKGYLIEDTNKGYNIKKQ